MEYLKLIKERRTAMGLTQARLATLVGVSQPHINDIENGKSKASIDVLFRIRDVLGIEISFTVKPASSG